MLKIEDGAICITRGDDGVLEITATDQNGEAYTMQEGDVLTLTVHELPSRNSVILLEIPSVPGSNRIPIRHEDTADAEVGRYSADVQLSTADGRRQTIWPDLTGSAQYKEKAFRNFIIMPEVTMT